MRSSESTGRGRYLVMQDLFPRCRFRTVWAMVMLAVAVCSRVTCAAEWYVNNVSGDDANDGTTTATAFATIRQAVASCATSDMLVLANTGVPYHESIVLDRLGGTPAKPFVVEGNGAVISGFAPLSVTQWERQDGDIWLHPQFRPGRRNPYLRLNGKRVASRRKAENLKPGQYAWLPEGIFFRPESGKEPADYHTDGTRLSSGLIIYSGSYIECRNLIAEGFFNDGFNIHGDCQGIVFRNIESRFNGDDGFSVHEDASTVVYNGWFHQNDYGIQDVHSARSSYYGVLVYSNRVSGVEFHGGVHVLVDALVRDNAGAQIKVTHSPAAHIGLTNTNLTSIGMSVLKNVVTTGGTTGLEVHGRGRVMASNCVFRDSETGVVVGSEAACHLTASVIHQCRDMELVSQSVDLELDNNVYHPGRFRYGKQSFDPAQWQAYRMATGQDRQSVIARPTFGKTGMLTFPLPDTPPKHPQLRPGLAASYFPTIRTME